jgi:hypothetical protein
MIRDEDLKSAVDYSQGQKDAAYSVLGEIVNLLCRFSDDIRIIGGWVPSLLYPDSEHIGSIDVDVLLNQLEIKNGTSYMTIKKILEKHEYRPHPDKYFSFVKTVMVDSIPYDVDVDFLSGKYGGTSGKRSKHVDGIKALPATGGNFAFEFPPENVEIKYKRPDGALDTGHVNVVSAVPYIVMKTEALGRGKPKDAYDIYCVINSYPGGVLELVKEFVPYMQKTLIQNMCVKLDEKFASPDHAGPADIVAFLDIKDEEEKSLIKQDAFQKIHYLTDSLRQH